MGRRGTTVVAWMIGLGALAAQVVLHPGKPVDVTLPALEVPAPALPAAQAQPGADGPVVEVLAQVG